MTTEERNNWILENNDEIVSCLSRYCEKNPELDYDELYSDIIVYLINYLDNKGLPNYYLSTVIGNYIHSILKTKKQFEIPVDFFELIFLEDFDFESSIVVESIVARAKLDTLSMTIVKEIAIDGYTYKQSSIKHNLAQCSVRRIYVDSIMRLRLAATSLKYNVNSCLLYF